MEIEQILSNILVGVLIAATPIIVAMCANALRLLNAWIVTQITKIKSETLSNALGLLQQRAYNMIHAAAQELANNTEKKLWVTSQLRSFADGLEAEFGITISDTEIDKLIEGIYHQVKDELGD